MSQNDDDDDGDDVDDSWTTIPRDKRLTSGLHTHVHKHTQIN